MRNGAILVCGRSLLASAHVRVCLLAYIHEPQIFEIEDWTHSGRWVNGMMCAGPSVRAGRGWADDVSEWKYRFVVA